MQILLSAALINFHLHLNTQCFILTSVNLLLIISEFYFKETLATGLIITIAWLPEEHSVSHQILEAELVKLVEFLNLWNIIIKIKIILVM